MRYLLLVVLFSFLLAACASCEVVKDLAEAPATLNQARIVMQVDDNPINVGIAGTIDGAKFRVRSYATGSINIRGLGECGFITSAATKEVGWVEFNLSDLPDREFCLYALQSTTEGFDAPAIGNLLIRKFKDSNVLPLTTVVNGVQRSGVNWIQLRKDKGKLLGGGINEQRDITINLNGHSGYLNITGCDTQPDTIEYDHQQTKQITIDALYRSLGSVSEDCVFTITANHSDALKESASIFIKLYDKNGSFLDAPVVEIKDDGACFEFTDPYVVGIRVDTDGKDSKSFCVDTQPPYEIEGVTSRQRTFFGIHDGKKWVEMQ